MEDFLKKFSSIPKKFIDDFYVIAKETYNENEIIIDFDIVTDWLNTRKDHLKEVLIKHFEKEFDYNETRTTKKHSKGGAKFIQILITPNCFKELCMISQTEKAKEVRKYFIEMEKLIKRYHEDIQTKMYKEIGLLKINQKPKTYVKGGVLYILRALNTDASLYKIGKTGDIKRRLATYNSGNANDVEPEFIIKVKDVESAENCVKASIKNYQFRKYKEIYEIDLQVLKEIIEKCSEISDVLVKYYEEKKAETRAKIQRMKSKDEKFFIVFVSDDEIKEAKTKSKSKSKSKTVKKTVKSKSKTKPVKKSVKAKSKTQSRSKTIKKVTKATKSKSKSSKKTVKSTRAKKIKSKSKSK